MGRLNGAVPLVAVDIPQLGDERGKNWAKVVTNVDGSLGTGWAYEGEFIAAGGIQDVPVGSVVLVYGERGSRDRPMINAKVFTANGDGTLTAEAEASGRAWARTLRDRVEELLTGRLARPSGVDGLPWSPELMQWSDRAILDEVERRGIRA
ncbi:MAG: hypothetical protein ACR2JP_10910 [Acidimicrobiia bacterium]